MKGKRGHASYLMRKRTHRRLWSPHRFGGRFRSGAFAEAIFETLWTELVANNKKSCSQAGVLGVLAGIMGTIQAAEAVKYLLGIGELLTNRMLVFNALKMTFREVAFRRDTACPLCGDRPTITALRDEVPAVCACANGRCDVPG